MMVKSKAISRYASLAFIFKLLQWAGGKIQTETLERVIFEGDIRTLRDIEILAGVNYGEDTMGKGVPLPKELSYLK